MIKNIGNMIGWEDDNEVVGPIAAAAKQSLLRLVPHILPEDDETSLYRLVFEHGDFGIHNVWIAKNSNGQPSITSIFDLETGCIAPAILSDPLMAVAVDLVVDEKSNPSYTRVVGEATSDEHVQFKTWTEQYFKVRSPLRSSF